MLYRLPEIIVFMHHDVGFSPSCSSRAITSIVVIIRAICFLTLWSMSVRINSARTVGKHVQVKQWKRANPQGHSQKKDTGSSPIRMRSGFGLLCFGYLTVSMWILRDDEYFFVSWILLISMTIPIITPISTSIQLRIYSHICVSTHLYTGLPIHVHTPSQ